MAETVNARLRHDENKIAVYCARRHESGRASVSGFPAVSLLNWLAGKISSLQKGRILNYVPDSDNVFGQSLDFFPDIPDWQGKTRVNAGTRPR
jgi:hypothetical protein